MSIMIIWKLCMRRLSLTQLILKFLNIPNKKKNKGGDIISIKKIVHNQDEFIEELYLKTLEKQ